MNSTRMLRAPWTPAAQATVVITEGSVPTYVLLTYDYLQMGGTAVDVVTLQSMNEVSDIDFEPPKVGIAGKLDGVC